MSLSSLQLLPLANWQDFERLARDLFSEEWGDPYAQLNGRTGQPQSGVDVYGRSRDGNIGVQCKGRDAGYGSALTDNEVRGEVEKAKAFVPPLDVFIIATTAPNDVAVQRSARLLSEVNRKAGLFEVHVFGWDTLKGLLAKHLSVARIHYSDYVPPDWFQVGQEAQFPRPEPGLDPGMAGQGRRSPAGSPEPVEPEPMVATFRHVSGVFREEDCQETLGVVRRSAGDPGAALAPPGPARALMAVKLQAAACSKLEDPVTAAELEGLGVHLVGMVPSTGFASLVRERDQLRRVSQALADWPRELPGGTHIDRPELEELLGRAFGSESSTTVVLGQPGAGKSALLAGLVQRIEYLGLTALALKADFLDTELRSEANLRENMGLDGPPSEFVLRAARLGPVFLVLDQLDALAGYSDLKTGRLNVLLNLVRKLGGNRNVHVVLSARTFEFEHDVRLKSITAESLELQLPSWPAVQEILASRDIAAAGWPEDAQEMMRSPQALATYLKLARVGEKPLASYQAMLEELWRERVLQRPGGHRLSQLVSDIAERMAETEALWLAAVRFEEHEEGVRVLLAGGILATGGPLGASLGFSHQTVFEHALSRRFAQREGALSSFVLARTTSLFVRPKLWAGLSYLRGTEPANYERELQEIWRSPGLPRHVRYLLVEFLGQQVAPSEAEAVLMVAALASPDRNVAMQALSGSSGWFRRLRLSHIGPAMAEGSPMASIVAGILRRVWNTDYGDVIELIAKRWLPDRRFDHLAWEVLTEARCWDEPVVAAARTIVRRTALSSFSLDNAVGMLGLEQPGVALDVVLAELDRQLAASRLEMSLRLTEPSPDEEPRKLVNAAEPLRRLLQERRGFESLASLAERNPGLTLERLWPWLGNLLESVRQLDDGGPLFGYALPYDCDFMFDEEDSSDLPEPVLLGALRIAFETLGRNDPRLAGLWFARLATEPVAPAQRIVAHVMATLPASFAVEALQFLLDDTARFHLGSFKDLGATTRRLIRACSPFWNDDQVRRCERAVMAYSPVPKRTLDARGRKAFRSVLRQVRLELLSSLPSEQLSASARQLVAEDRRVFPESRLRRSMQGGFVGSPVSRHSLVQANDRAVLNAFRSFPDHTEWHHPQRYSQGGNIQLSREFASIAKENPGRAAQIIAGLEPSYGTRASAYAVEAMAGSADPAVVLGLIRDLHARGFDGEEFRVLIARALERLLDRDVEIGDEFVGILESWLQLPVAAEEDDVAEDVDGLEAADGSFPEFETGTIAADHQDGSILWNVGFSSLPGGNFPILETLARILLRRNEHDRVVAICAQHIGRPESHKVWRALLRLFASLRPASASVLSSFLGSLLEKYPQLDGSAEAAFLLVHARWVVPDLVQQVLERWQCSALGFVQQAFGEVVTVVAITQPELGWPATHLEDIAAGRSVEAVRVGAAYAAVNLWREDELRPACADLLQQLIPRAAGPTWEAILDLFRLVDEITPTPDWVGVLRAIGDHLEHLPGVGTSFLAEKLETLLPHEGPLVAKIARHLISTWGSDLGDIRNAAAATTPAFVDLALTLHRLGPDTRDAGTQLFEDLLELDAYSARQTLEQIDNRFTSSVRAPRQRLPRRSRQRRSGGRIPAHR